MLMLTFGAGLGNSMLARITFATAAYRFVFGDWLHIVRF
jgi:hypothetical protein